jgi:6-phosphofructokinase 1
MTELNIDLTIPVLGEPRWRSPLDLSTMAGDGIANYTPEDARILLDPVRQTAGLSFELAGPRERIYFKGDEIAAGIVTCGGLCPGMNNVIRSLVMLLWYGYGVRRIIGFRYGFAGMAPDTPYPHSVLTPDDVLDIQLMGGTVLGASRGNPPPSVMVDALHKLGINVLFCIGGDGTMRGAHAIYEDIRRRGAEISVIGVPKTIDNDILYNERTFGFDTAVSVATEAIKAAHVEALGAPNGVGLVKLMGRNSGFVAAAGTLASRVVNLVLVPELGFNLHGDGGLMQFIRKRLKNRGHCVIVAAEGAGQPYVQTEDERDASGNQKLGDIGVFLRDTIKREFSSEGISLKYIDPSYIIRAAPANPTDAIFCGSLAEDAVHAAMTGKTGMMVGTWLSHYTHVPFTAVIGGRKTVSLDSAMWRNVIEATGQPRRLGV